MCGFKELTYEDLMKNVCNPEKLGFENTSEISGIAGIIGEERAKAALQFGCTIDKKGYNMYISGDSGSGKTTYARTYIKKLVNSKPVPLDWCYVYNFEFPDNPVALSFQPGEGRKFKEDMEEFVEDLLVQVRKAFSEDEYDKRKHKILKAFEKQKDSLMNEISERAKELGFVAKASSTGIYFLPLVDGEMINEEQYAELPENVQMQIQENSKIVQTEASEMMKKMRQIDKDIKAKIERLDYEIGLFVVGASISELKKKYQDNKKVTVYLDNVKHDILDNIKSLYEDEAEDEQQQMFPWGGHKKDETVKKYKVNLFIDNTKKKGAPLIVDFNPNFYNLVGKVEYQNEMGNLVTDFMKIKPGLLHQANGGYLILQVEDVLKKPFAWDAIKRALKTKEVEIESLREQQGSVVISSLKPENIPIDLKIVLVGSNYLYHVLYDNDEDFRKLFKIKVDFDVETEKSTKNIKLMSKFIRSFVDREKTKHLDKYAVAEVIQYCSRLVENQTKITTKYNEIVELLIESSAWAELEGAEIITSSHVKKALHEKEMRSNLYEEKLDKMIDEDMLMIDTDGERIGQINGLAVLDTGDYTFGKPTRITATTYMGRSGIINIEKEASMSGKIHNKGAQILAGYLGNQYAQDRPLSLACRVSFEQNYSGIDGDSASSTELYAILSSLADIPIKQSFAVTGSINQWGDIQPIGGVTHKVEGFFKLCNSRGLTGDQGVIIPWQNVKELVLKQDVVEAVKQGKFHIYPVKNIEEGIEILTGVKAGVQGDDGKYPQDSIHGKVIAKLTRFHKEITRDEERRKSKIVRHKKTKTDDTEKK